MSTGPAEAMRRSSPAAEASSTRRLPEHEAALDIAAHQPVVHQRESQPVHGGPGQSRGRHQLRQGGGAGLKCVKHMGRFIDDTDSTRIVHVMILPSHYLRCKSTRWRITWRVLVQWKQIAGGTSRIHRSEGSRPWQRHWPRKSGTRTWCARATAKGQRPAGPPLHRPPPGARGDVSPQAFEGLRLAGRPLRRPDLTIATEDHNTPTLDIDKPIADLTSRTQIQTLRNNCAEFGVRLHSLGDAEQGIVHVVGPQLGLTQPGMTVVCGDSHTSTHGAFGALAMGIGTSEVEHVMATQTLSLKPFKTMAINVEGTLRPGVSAKDIILAVIAKIGTGGGQGYVLEYRGSAIRALSMEARMTICNMSIEAGARAGLVAPDQTTYDYMHGRPHAPDRAPTGMPPSNTGTRCTPTTTQRSTSRWTSTPTRWNRS